MEDSDEISILPDGHVGEDDLLPSSAAAAGIEAAFEAGLRPLFGVTEDERVEKVLRRRVVIVGVVDVDVDVNLVVAVDFRHHQRRHRRRRCH